MKRAAYYTAADLAFIAPEVITPLLVKQIREDLNPGQLTGIGATEVAIARTPEGTAFIDVLASKAQNQLPDRNTKDYDTLKWEEELRSQLAQKKGQQKKLTPDQQAKVNAQLIKEASIRHNLHSVESRLSRGVGFIRSLATGPPTEAELWMSPAVHSLLNVISAGAGHLVGDAAAIAYLDCAQRVSTRLGTIRSFIGTATLRAFGFTHLPLGLEEEPLGGKWPRTLIATALYY